MRMPTIAVCILVLIGAARAAELAKPIVAPKAEKSDEQRAKDMAAAQVWAIEETGVDPAAVLEELEWQDVKDRHARKHGAAGRQAGAAGRIAAGVARGAAYGAIDEAVDNRVASGAIIGGVHAAGREVRDGERRKAKEKVSLSGLDRKMIMQHYQRYQKAYSAYLEARGYVVKW